MAMRMIRPTMTMMTVDYIEIFSFGARIIQ